MFVSKFSTYYFHMKTKIIPDFQICISVPLNKSFIWISNFVHLIFWKNKFNAGIVLFHDTRSKNLLSNDSRSNDARFILKLSKQAQIMQGKLCYQKAKFYSTKNRAAGPCEQTFLRDIMLSLAVDFRQISTYKLQRQPFADDLQNSFSQKLYKINRKSPVPESLYKKVADLQSETQI